MQYSVHGYSHLIHQPISLNYMIFKRFNDDWPIWRSVLYVLDKKYGMIFAFRLTPQIIMINTI